MRDVTEKVCWATTDHMLYDSEDEARAEQAILDLEETLNNDSLLGSTAGSRVEFCTLYEWLLTNREAVMQFLTTNDTQIIIRD